MTRTRVFRSSTFKATFLSLSLLAPMLSGCTPRDDGDSYSLSEQVAAGQTIRLDPVPTHERASVYRLTYRSTDARNANQLVRVSAQVLVPNDTPPAGGWPVLAWAHGASGIGLTCAPSVMGIGTVQARFYDGWLQQGFAIVATDYPGLGEPGAPLFLNARSEGMSILDAIRAAHSRLPDLSQNVVLAGHSQGGQAVIAAAGLAPTYTPGIHILGTIAAAPHELDAEGAHTLLNPRNPRQFSPSVPLLLMLGASYSEANPSFDPARVFTPRALHLIHEAKTTCIPDFFALAHRSGLTIANMLQPDAETALAPALEWARYPSLKLSTPVFIGTGTQDVHALPSEQKRLVADLCASGTSVTQHIYPGVNHNDTLSASRSDSHAFARQLLNGEEPRASCPAH